MTQTQTAATERPKRGRPVGRTTTVRDSDTIEVLVADNPKRGLAADRFALLTPGLTVAGYVDAVGDRKQALRDLAWNLRKGMVRLVPAEPAGGETAN